MQAVVTGLVVLGFGFVVVAFLMPTIFIEADTTRATANTETGLTCTTGVGETSCAVTLGTENAYADTTAITITETAPGSADRTAGATLASDRVTLTVAGLSASTAYTFTVAHNIVNPDLSASAAGFLERLPLFVVIGLLIVGVVGIARALPRRS